MGQLKRRRPQHLLRPDEMLATLSSVRLHALLQRGGIWLAVTPEMSELLNQCCTGQMDGGPGTAAEVHAVLTSLVGEPQALTAGAHDFSASGAAAMAPEAVQAGVELHQLNQPQARQEAEAAGANGLQAMDVDAALQQQEQPAAEQAAGGTDPLECRIDEPGQAGSSGFSGGEGGNAAEDNLPLSEVPPTVGESYGTAGVARGAVAAEGATDAGGHQSAAGWFGGGRGRGRRGGGGPQLPYSPAAEGCRLVAIRLTLEEAFFLKFVLRCLEVYELRPGLPIPATAEHVRLLDTEELWRACCATRSNFVTSYAAYHHLKAKGWIPRSGLLYGVDYVIYQLHPVGAHSDFGVMVMPLGPGGARDSGGPHAPPLSWLDLQITNRLINQVVKKLILLYLYERPGPDHSTPRCLENFAVEERIVRRWVPDATRD